MLSKKELEYFEMLVCKANRDELEILRGRIIVWQIIQALKK